MPTFRRAKLEPGIYDDLVSAHLRSLIGRLPPSYKAESAGLSKSEALSTTLRSLLSEALANVFESLDGDPSKSLVLAESLLATLHAAVPSAFREGELRLEASRLLGITAPPAQAPARPRGSLHASSLIVNAEGESLLEHLRSEFDSADRVDLLCAFVKVSGFEKFRAELERHCSERGRPLRVLTTTYMGASDAAAVERLASLPNALVKVSYDEHVTRLHAKAWIFHRASGFSSAYVGSSNLSHAAQTEGLEWNVRMVEADQPALLTQMRETFEQYWEDRHTFEAFDARSSAHKMRLRASLSAEHRGGDADSDVLVELEAKPFQKPVLEELVRARELGRHQNLLVAATGTGKTVMAALDYRALREAGSVDTLLYVAHRREILDQARKVFRNALQMREFGELLYQGKKPAVMRHVFASIDSLTEKSGVDLSAFDMVILDEAHHAAADTWDALLEKVKKKELLGLTGTPERTDGADYERHFPRPWIGNLRVWNAIPNALVPFRYYMLDVEGVDLREVGWDRGGYVTEELGAKLITAADVFVRRAVKAVAEHIGISRAVSPERGVAGAESKGQSNGIRAIAFCATVSHAHAVHERFIAHGFRSQVLTGETPAAERSLARGALDSGQVEVLCVVDIYNEGIDVPNVNTLFFFRPTESATVFLQQFGRGLRRTRNKAELVVFDLTGRQHLKFRFDRRLRALLGQTPRELRELVETNARQGRLPAGCLLHFDEQAQADVLEQIRRSIPSDLAGIKSLLAEPAHKDLSLDAFLRETDVELGDIYRSGRSWTELRRLVGLEKRALSPGEDDALACVPKLTHVGDARRLDVWERLVHLERTRSEAEHRLARMLFVQLYGKETAASDAKAAALWKKHAVLREEIAALIPALRRLNAVLARAHELAPEIPLALHARYAGPELSAAFDARTTKGVFRDFYMGTQVVGDEPKRYDLLLVTLNKGASTKEHLRYRDFPLSERRFHWQSQANTTRESATGQRHLHPEKQGITPLLLVRERTDDRPSVTMAFQYLGPVTPHSSEGERPITIEWDLVDEMPVSLLSNGRVAA